jgi:serine/threonine protein kinase
MSTGQNSVSPVEPLCRAFAAAWEAGGRPIIDDYLIETPAPVRAELLVRLIQIDLANRWRLNEKPSPEEYSARFPKEEAAIRALFRDTPTMVVTQMYRPVPEAGRSLPTEWPEIPGYELLAQLPAGGMGIVYRARHIALNRTVALKMIRTETGAGAEERARFRVEAEAIASLSHPHIIQIYDYGECNGLPYLAMEFADGGSLAQRLANSRLPATQAAQLVETLARALQFVHERGIIHRDLKPANVLLTDQDVPKLADFGLAKRLDHDEGLTGTRAVLGTASYMAPEQAAGDKQAIGPTADIYALGAILYELFTGRPPFRADTRELTIHQLLSEEPAPLSRLADDVPAELEAICLKCLEKDPRRRFATALDVADDLRRYLNGEPISIRSFGAFERHSRSARRAGYEILEKLASRPPAILYKARHLSLNRNVVLEVIAGLHLDVTRLARLRAEAEVIAQLHHPNIVEVYDFGDLNGEPFVAMEYVEGTGLADQAALRSQPAEQTAALVETLARAIHHAHLRGVIHGKLQLSSVLVPADGACKITDFGLAALLLDEDALTTITPATDVYALGALLYGLLTGKLAPGTPVGETPEQSRLCTPEPLRLLRPDLPHEVDAICFKCLEQDPVRRYPSAAALAEDLRRFRTGEVLYIDDLDDVTQQERWARRAGYEILEVLGQNPELFTYKARQRAVDRTVILKRIASAYRFVPVAKERFRWEGRLLARLSHPSFVQLYDHGEQNDLAYFAREFVDGPSLTEVAAEMYAPGQLGRRPGVDPDAGSLRNAARWVEALARAIQVAHAHRIVHGGLHTGNVRLSSGGVPKITRCRTARVPARDSEERHPETEIRRRACYLAPEQLEGRRRLDRATDIYALGAIFYTLLTGQPPCLGRDLAETLVQVRSQPPERPSRHQPDIPTALETICLRCLEKQPSRRFPDAMTLAEELHQAIG